jgi:hypothetical protein
MSEETSAARGLSGTLKFIAIVAMLAVAGLAIGLVLGVLDAASFKTLTARVLAVIGIVAALSLAIGALIRR